MARALGSTRRMFSPSWGPSGVPLFTRDWKSSSLEIVLGVSWGGWWQWRPCPMVSLLWSSLSLGLAGPQEGELVRCVYVCACTCV